MDKELSKKLLYKPLNVFLNEDVKQNADEYCKGYREFIDSAKTEREAVDYAVMQAEKNGFVAYDRKASYKPGDRVYYVNRKIYSFFFQRVKNSVKNKFRRVGVGVCAYFTANNFAG